MKDKNDCCHSSSYRNSCLKALRSSGYRITKARLAVIESLASSSVPKSAPEIYSDLSSIKNGTEHSIDKVSVYRVLEALEKLGLVHRVSPSGGYIACSHLECSSRYHVISHCKNCSKVEENDIPPELVAAFFSHMRKKFHFQPDEHLMHLEGTCRDCNN